jgi:RHS repeat-associated protein
LLVVGCGSVSDHQQLKISHADHLATPRLIADENQKTVWRWDNQEPFGNNPANEDPDGDSIAFEFNLRFPGQYFDKETGLFQNVRRDYDAAIGRYIESDPIGIGGGLNTFVYAVGDPLGHVDPLGLAIWLCNRQVRIPPFVGNHAYLWNDKTQRCCGRDQGRDPMNDCREWGPPIDSCVLVAGSPGKEDQIMKCCQDTANTGRWIPFINDCVESAQRCIEKFGLTYPGAPGGRMGQCDSCYQKPPTPWDPPFLR